MCGAEIGRWPYPGMGVLYPTRRCSKCWKAFRVGRRLTFQVDLFHARGCQPTDLEEVGEREKDIRYSSKDARHHRYVSQDA